MRTFLISGILLLAGLLTRAQETGNLEYVDPTIGNVGALLQPTRPTVQLPHQMIRVYPMRKDYTDDQITDFPLIIVSHRLGQAFSIKPARGVIDSESWTRPMSCDQGAEVTRPWYYSSYLLDDDVTVEFTPGKKTGIYRFVFGGGRSKNLLLGLYNAGDTGWRFHPDGAITGIETYHGDIPVYMYGRFSTHGSFREGPARAWISFPNEAPDTIEFRYAISYIDAGQAKRNFESELQGQTFASLEAEGKAAWAKVIGQIQVEGGTTGQKRSFYTALYRCNERMVDITEDGQYYSGFDNKVHTGASHPFYVDDWIWDTYLALHPLRAILDPSLERDMLNSYVTMYGQSGWMPTFPVLFGDHACMNGFHSSIMILDDYRKGIKPDDPSGAYEGMRKNATQATLLPWRNGPATALDSFYYDKGYFPALRVGERETFPEVSPSERRQAVAVTLGASYDDWAVAQMAHELGKDSDYHAFMRRSANYRNLWNPGRRMFLPKDDKGDWIPIDPKFDGGSGGRDYYDENNGWTYLWQVQEDIGGLVGLMGGKDAFEARLDQLFREGLDRSKSEFWYKFPDATGLVGQYSMGNEPSFHIPYLYNFTDAPWKTQERIRLLLDLWFKDNVFGIPGDEDGGGMSAFVVFSSMGFYPMTPGLPLYTIGSPVFEKVTINLPNGRQFKVIAHGCSRINKYIQRASFDGLPLNTPWFTHEQLMAGGVLELDMGPRPNKEWGKPSSSRLEFAGRFAPTSDAVKPVEQPYREDICLDGSWQFQPVVLPAGLDAVPVLPPAPAADGWDATPIRIPSPWNVNSFADKNGQGGDFRCYPSYPSAWDNVKMAWLRKTFTVPAGWKGKQVHLHFEAVAGDAEILVNGRPVGHHFGIFLPFDVDVTAYVAFGDVNELTVGVRKASLFDRRGAYGRRTYQAGSFWGQHIAGIWQDVYVTAVPDLRVADAFVKPLVDEDRLSAELTITNEEDEARRVSVEGQVYKWAPSGGPSPSDSLEKTAALDMAPVTTVIPPHTTVKVALTAPVKGRLSLWSPDHPNLYGLVIQMSTRGRSVDRKFVRFGWRQTMFKGNQFLLNGQPIVLRGDSWHFLGIPQMTRRYAWAWFTALHAAHLNAVRLHAQPYPSFYLDMADEMGVLVLDETAVWASDGGPKLDDSSFWRDTERQLSEQILRDRNHPSVFGWSASNEVKPIVQGVMRNPPGMMDRLVQYYGIWADVCRRLDPTRPWVSCDGEDDGAGKLPVYIVHYGGYTAMDRAHDSGKPWGVGEAGNAYYGTPEQVAGTNGDRAYVSFLGRMEGVAASSYQSLIAQRDRGAIYRSVFNLVWYGLQPLPLGMKDTTRPPTLTDGVYFTHFVEGEPGVQPERLGPYCTTLNPGYDPALPLYRTWPLFDAIRDASEEPPGGAEKYATAPPSITAAPLAPTVTSLTVLGGDLAGALRRTGVPVDRLAQQKEVPQVLFIDGRHPPEAGARAIVDRVLDNGGTVMVWDVSGDELPALNRLLPAPLEVTSRRASSLLPVTPDAATTGITPADLYFSELRPPEVMTAGLAGPLVTGGSVLLEACNTDWLQWNKQPEYAKTAMILRSEREAKPSGAALVSWRAKQTDGSPAAGRLLVTTLSPAPRLLKEERVIRKILSNLGIPLEAGNDVGKPLLKDGGIVRVMLCGSFPAGSPALPGSKPWNMVYSGSGQFDLGKLITDGPRQDAVAYLSFWVSSPRALDDLLLEPNMPVVNMEVTADDAAQVWLNGQMIIGDKLSATGRAEALKLHQGWNHFLIKVIQTGGDWQFSGRLTCNQPDFLAGLESALEKP